MHVLEEFHFSVRDAALWGKDRLRTRLQYKRYTNLIRKHRNKLDKNSFMKTLIDIVGQQVCKTMCNDIVVAKCTDVITDREKYNRSCMLCDQYVPYEVWKKIGCTRCCACCCVRCTLKWIVERKMIEESWVCPFCRFEGN